VISSTRRTASPLMMKPSFKDPVPLWVNLPQVRLCLRL